ncbi:MAG TPA: hypothetical protein VHD87_13335, partial [Acidimicrobiales bacterium]|nr:hypothetical protein [Acidimicrobiales bacterium]
CPQLIFNACGPDPMANVEQLAWTAPIMAAYRAGLGRDLDALAAAHPSIEVETMPDAAHYLVFTHADAVADRIARFVSTLPD